MSSNQDNEPMRPIPDGGLKDNMPNWLKRPPAWRDLPTAQERFERSLPEPDTSEIDPHSLVDVSDLPQWLQRIAERGPVPPPEPDPVAQHAVQVLQQAHAAEHGPRPVTTMDAVMEEQTKPESTGPAVVEVAQQPVPESAPAPEASLPANAEAAPPVAAETQTVPVAEESVSAGRTMLTPGLMIAAFVIAGLLLIALLNL